MSDRKVAMSVKQEFWRLFNEGSGGVGKGDAYAPMGYFLLRGLEEFIDKQYPETETGPQVG